ncbi:MAG: MFS transporter [Ardenticatenaceae bacterium]|nr:MFS transporter [Anaerolineales bacterium]MCB8939091.1 MFS transporter [Ardenticatenaceae bacterium]MCB8974848.1 MFS transporter [Ardenticatenaceae bacterium]
MLTNRYAWYARPVTIGSAYYGFFWPMVALYAPFFNVYLLSLGFSGTQMGILAAVFPLFALGVSPGLSALADQRGWRRQLLRLSLLGWALVLFLFRFPTTFVPMLLLVILESAMRSPALPIADGLIARMAVRHQLNFGDMRLWGSLGFAAVSILSGIIWQRTGYSYMFMAAAIAVLPALVIARKLEEGEVAEGNGRRSARFLAQDKGIITLIASAFLLGIALFGTYIFIGVYIKHLGGTDTHVGLLFGLSALAEVPIMRYSGAIIRKLEGSRALLLAMVLLFVATLGNAVAWSPVSLIAFNLFRGIGYGLFVVVMVQMLNERAPEGWNSTAQSMFQAAFFGLAPLLTSPINGKIYDLWGGSLLFSLMTAVIGLSIILLLLAMRQDWFAPHNWQFE